MNSRGYFCDKRNASKRMMFQSPNRKVRVSIVDSSGKIRWEFKRRALPAKESDQYKLYIESFETVLILS